MIARGSTRLTAPVIISPSRLANLSKTWSRSTSRIRWRTICLAVWAPIRPKTSPGSSSVSTSSPGLASALWRARLVERELDERVLDLVDGDLGPEHADLAGLGVDPDVDVLVAGDAPIGGLDAVLDRVDQLLSGDLLLGVELEEGTDEIATHDASFAAAISGGPT